MQDSALLRDEFVRELGLSALPADRQAAFLADLEELFAKKVMAAVAETLGEEGLREYEAYAEAHTVEEAAAWLKGRLPDHETLQAGVKTRLIADLKTAML